MYDILHKASCTEMRNMDDVLLDVILQIMHSESPAIAITPLIDLYLSQSSSL
jgi:hypothetical protein